MEKDSPTIEKIVYFVRHGQTEANVADTIQDLTDVLSPHGEIQAEKIAERAQNLEFEALIASDAVRAQQTASIIAKRTQHSIISSELFREIQRPSSFVNKSRLSDEFQAFVEMWWSRSSEQWRHSDEETAQEFIARAAAAFSFIEARSEKSMLVVTHGYFLRALVIHVLCNGEPDGPLFQKLHGSFMGENTGITVCLKKGGRWHLLTWNDHAHLG